MKLVNKETGAEKDVEVTVDVMIAIALRLLLKDYLL